MKYRADYEDGTTKVIYVNSIKREDAWKEAEKYEPDHGEALNVKPMQF